jgi:signal transduction histidine kinase
MARHFLQLYALIVLTLIATSWGQEQITRTSASAAAALEDPAQTAVAQLIADRLRGVPADRLDSELAALARRTAMDLELFELQDIAGAQTLVRLNAGQPSLMEGANGQSWLLSPLDDGVHVIAFKFEAPAQQRGVVDWALTLAFFAAIAFVIMLWLWPLSRDLRELERSTTTFGHRNWRFDANIGPRSQIYPLAAAFRRMAARIDGLIGSQKDMSNAVSHEIKTPLARMRFEVEMARAATTPAKIGEHLDHINTDIAELNAFVTATLDYAILERAEVALNVASHDFTQVLPAICDSVRRTARETLAIECSVARDATSVACDAHLMETAIRNILYNALRYARQRIRVDFRIEANDHVLRIDDDGPGIAFADRERVFESFVQLGEGTKSGYGLGLAIVKRIVEWHDGSVAVTDSDLIGARFEVRWPARVR